MTGNARMKKAPTPHGSGLLWFAPYAFRYRPGVAFSFRAHEPQQVT